MVQGVKESAGYVDICVVLVNAFKSHSLVQGILYTVEGSAKGKYRINNS